MTLRSVLATPYFGNTVGAWLVALGAVLGGWGALVVLRRALLRRLERLAPQTATYLDDLAAGAVRRTSRWFLLLVALSAATRVVLALPSNLHAALGLAVRIALLLQAASWGNGAVTFWLERVSRQRAQTDRASLTTLNALGVLARLVLWVLIFLLALDAFGVDVTALVTGLGIAGVAVALAVQNVLGDLLASLSIALDKPFVIGDTIAFETFIGTVEDIGLKTTRIRSLSGEQLVVSNAELLKARIRNYGRMAERRVLFTIGIGYETPPALVSRAPQIIREAVARIDQARFDRSHFQGFQDSVLNLETVYYVLSSDYTLYMDIQQRINLEILERFRAEGIEFAFPTRTIVLRTEPGAPGGELVPRLAE